MAGLGLKAVLYGVDKVPDSWFHAIPGGYFRPPDVDRKKKEQKELKSRRRHHRDGQDFDDYEEEDNDPKYKGRARSEDGRNRDGDRYHRRDAEYDYARRGYDSRGYDPGAAAVGAGAGAAAASTYGDDRPLSSGPAAGYVPYAHIYSQDNQQYGVEPHYDQQYARGHPQDDYDQHYSRSAAEAYAQPGQDYDHRYDSRHERTTRRHDDRRDRRRDHSQDDSRSDSRFDSEDDHRQRRRERKRDSSRSRRKSPDGKREKSRARSSVRDKFDLTERGLGYGSVGALAGGLIGSEVGKGGLLPAAAGAIVGGLGANAFEARDRAKEARAKKNAYGSRRDSRRTSRRDYESE